MDDKFYLAHCISADYALGAGIAVEFQKKYHLRDALNQCGSHQFPDCILTGKVFNLVTKGKCWGKPTYQSLHETLVLMRTMAISQNIRQIAMPAIGCGLDRLQLHRVQEDIRDVFADTDILILMCLLK